MPSFPPLTFYLADEQTPVTPDGSLWPSAIPLGRSTRSEGPDPKRTIPYGDYFEACSDFLRRCGVDALTSAAAQMSGRPVSTAAVDEIRVFLEKHGAFYHPSRVVLQSEPAPVCFVLNVALAKEGRRRIEDEFALLSRLAAQNARWLPRTFCIGSGQTQRKTAFPMFLGEWFDGFCEFHLAGDGDRTRIWDPAAGSQRVSGAHRREIYRAAARIMGDYYDVDTGARVHPWHHAAGDFVARIAGGRPDLRLVTVRGYPPVLPPEGAGRESKLRALLSAFLHLSLRTRLDRAHGTGELLWADASAVEPTLVGFVEALAEKPFPAHGDEPLSMLLLRILNSLSVNDLRGLVAEAIDEFPPHSEEASLCRRHATAHVGDVQRAVGSLTGAGPSG